MKIVIEGLARLEGGDLSLRISLRDTGYCEIRSFAVTADDGKKLDLRPGQDLSEEEFERISGAAEFRTALRKGLELLAYGANSGGAIRRKLCARGYSPDIARRAVEHLARRGYINESADAGAVAHSSLSKGYGRARIIMKLREGGYGDEAIGEVRDMLEEIDFTDRCAKLALKKYGGPPADRRESERMAAALARYGYSFPEIRGAFRLLSGEGE